MRFDSPYRLSYFQWRYDHIVFGIAAVGGGYAQGVYRFRWANYRSAIREFRYSLECHSIVANLDVSCQEEVAAQVDVARLCVYLTARERLSEAILYPVAFVSSTCSACGSVRVLGYPLQRSFLRYRHRGCHRNGRGELLVVCFGAAPSAVGCAVLAAEGDVAGIAARNWLCVARNLARALVFII